MPIYQVYTKLGEIIKRLFEEVQTNFQTELDTTLDKFIRVNDKLVLLKNVLDNAYRTSLRDKNPDIFEEKINLVQNYSFLDKELLINFLYLYLDDKKKYYDQDHEDPESIINPLFLEHMNTEIAALTNGGGKRKKRKSKKGKSKKSKSKKSKSKTRRKKKRY